jgi:Family of unknown function (DUF5330)
MRFLLRVAFWLSVVVLLLPSAPSERAASTPQIGTTEAVSAASAAVSDMRQFCTRQPEACAVGGQALVQFGRKAEAGARMLYEFLNERFGAEHTGTASVTGSVAAHAPERPVAATAARPQQHTLTPADLAPAWRGPMPRREVETKRPA